MKPITRIVLLAALFLLVQLAGYDSNEVSALGSTGEKEADWQPYADEALSFSVLLPTHASVTSATGAPGSSTTIALENLRTGQPVYITFGLFLAEKPATVSLPEWVLPHQTFANDLKENGSITDLGLFTYWQQYEGQLDGEMRNVLRVYGEAGTKVYYADLEPGTRDVRDLFYEILKSFRVMNENGPFDGATRAELSAYLLSEQGESSVMAYASELPNDYGLPTLGDRRITQLPGEGPTHGCHSGQIDCGAFDIDVIEGRGSHPDNIDPIFAPAAGVLYYLQAPYGNTVQIVHDNGATTYLGHLKEFRSLLNGQRVQKGVMVGTGGCTVTPPGYCTGSHLHWIVRPNSESNSEHVSIEGIRGLAVETRMAHGPVVLNDSGILPIQSSNAASFDSDEPSVPYFLTRPYEIIVGKRWYVLTFSEENYQGNWRAFGPGRELVTGSDPVRSLKIYYDVCPLPPAGNVQIGEDKRLILASGEYPDCEPDQPPTSDGAAFSHVESPLDNTIFSPGQSFQKTWQMRNIGTSTWGQGYQLVFIGGARMGAPTAVNIPAAAPGQTVDISVNLVAPNQGGTHRGNWRLRNPQGTYFGDPIWVQIVVPDNSAPAPSTNDISLRCTNCPSEVTPGATFRPTIVATVNRGQLLQSRGDMLRHKSGDAYGVWPHIAVNGSVGQGGSYSFTFYADNPIHAPNSDGTYRTTWQVWQDGRWAGEEYTIEFRVRSGGGGSNHRPNSPSLQSPHDWYMYYSGNQATLCARSNGDPDGDAVTHYYFDIYESAQLWNSGWRTSSCVTTGALDSHGYKWRVKVRDSRGLESDWSDSWHFTIANPNLSITSLYVESLDSRAERVRIRACTEGQGGVGITMRVSVNSANDGSSNGMWKVLKELGVPCFNEIDAPTWNTLEYESGPHRIRVEAHGWGSGWQGAAVREMTYNVRSDHRPDSPSTLKPDHQTWQDSRTVRFEWRRTLRTSSYRLQASTSSDFSSLILNQTLGASTTSYTHTFPDTYSTVHWRVIAYGPHGQNDATSRFYMDTSPPSSTVTALPGSISNAAFTVSWSGSDIGSGIRWYHVQVRDGNRTDSQWEDWHEQTALKNDTFVGQPGHTYYFRVRSMDKVSHWESWPDAVDGDTYTQVDISASTAGTSDLVVVSLETYPDPNGGMIVQAVFENQGDTATQNGFYTDLYSDHLPSGSGDFVGSLRFWVNDPVTAGARVHLTTRIDDAATLAALNGRLLARAPLAPAEEVRNTLYAQVDSAGAVREPDDGNNISEGTELCLAAPDQYEGNDDEHTNAPYMAVDERQLRNFDRPNDEDWVRFYAWEGITYVPHTYGLGETADTYLYLYTDDGTTLLASNDDAGSLASQLTWTAPESGHYYLRIRQWNPNSGGCGTQYMLGLLPLQVSSQLNLTPQTPMVGEVVTATVTVQSTTPAPIVLTRMAIGAHGPDCTDWDCGRAYDFPWQREVTIEPGVPYIYRMQRVFLEEGANYFGQLIYSLSETDWHPTGTRITFNVSPGLAMRSGLTLEPTTPVAGEPITASYSVRNRGPRPIRLPYLGLVARGPDCSSWECPWNDFPHEENVTLQPGQTHVYSAERAFYEVGGGYFAEPAFGDSNDWWFPVPGSEREAFEITPGITLVEGLSLTQTQPQAGETVVARFQLRNDSLRPLTLQRLGVGVHGPDCEDWDCGRPHDFPWLRGITLQPGAVYTYEEERTFAEAGDGYFAQIIYGFTEHDWPRLGEMYHFSVGAGIEIESPLTLSTLTPAAGTPVTATFTIRNAGHRPIEAPYIRAVSRGPNCDDWRCTNALDFPHEADILLLPGESHTYRQQQVFQQQGIGYFAEAAYADGNGWWMPLADAERVEFVVTSGIVVVQELTLSPAAPVTGEIVTATFAIRNDATQAITIRRLVAAVQGPDCQDWSCDRPQDFPWLSNIVLQPGELYTYEEHRPFLGSGDDYFGQIIHGVGETDWHPTGERLLFAVQPGLTMVDDLTLSPVAPIVGEQVMATYRIRNDGPRPLELPTIGLVARGPGCTNWECGPILDFPHAEDIYLNPGAIYTFHSSRTFNTTGSHFAVPAFSDYKGWWYTLPGGAPTNFVVNVEGTEIDSYRSLLPVIINDN